MRARSACGGAGASRGAGVGEDALGGGFGIVCAVLSTTDAAVVSCASSCVVSIAMVTVRSTSTGGGNRLSLDSTYWQLNTEATNSFQGTREPVSCCCASKCRYLRRTVRGE